MSDVQGTNSQAGGNPQGASGEARGDDREPRLTIATLQGNGRPAEAPTSYDDPEQAMRAFEAVTRRGLAPAAGRDGYAVLADRDGKYEATWSPAAPSKTALEFSSEGAKELFEAVSLQARQAGMTHTSAVRDEADATPKARDFSAAVASEAAAREHGLVDRRMQPAEAIAYRALRYENAFFNAKEPALKGLGADAEKFNAVYERRDVEVVSVETAQRWAKLDADDFRRIDDPAVRAGIAQVMGANHSARYHDALRIEAPDVADAVRSVERGSSAVDQGESNRPVTTRDAVVGAAHAAQALGAQGGLKAAAQTIGAADVALVASDIAQGKEVRALDAATAAASAIASAKLGGPAVQAGAQAVAAVGAVDMAARVANGRTEGNAGEREPGSAEPLSDRHYKRLEEDQDRRTPMGRSEAAALVSADVRDLRATTDPIQRRNAALFMGELAQGQPAYRQMLEERHPSVAREAKMELILRDDAAYANYAKNAFSVKEPDGLGKEHGPLQTGMWRSLLQERWREDMERPKNNMSAFEAEVRVSIDARQLRDTTNPLDRKSAAEYMGDVAQRQEAYNQVLQARYPEAAKEVDAALSVRSAPIAIDRGTENSRESSRHLDAADAPTPSIAQGSNAIHLRWEADHVRPQNSMSEREAQERVTEDVRSLLRMTDPIARSDAAGDMGHIAQDQAAYRRALEGRHPEVVQEVTRALISEEMQSSAKEARKAADMPELHPAGREAAMRDRVEAPDNGIELVALRRAQDRAPADAPEVAELRRQAIEALGPPIDRATERLAPANEAPAKDTLAQDKSAANASTASETSAAPSKPAVEISQRERDDRQFAKEVLEGMTTAEILAYAAARTRDPKGAEKMLEAAAKRIERSEAPSAPKAPTREGESVNALEDRFNVRERLIGREYLYRDKPGQTAFKEGIRSMRTTHDDVAVIKGMLDRAAERGWGTINVAGSAEFKRQAWIAAEARGIKAVGYSPTQQDRAEASKEAQRLSPSMTGGEVTRTVADHVVTRDTARRAADTAARQVAPEAPLARPSETLARPVREQLSEAVHTARQAAAQETVRPGAVSTAAQASEGPVKGRLIEHGPAPYKFVPDAPMNYYVKLATTDGEKTIWGVDIKRALELSGAHGGQEIQLEHITRTPVTVKAKGQGDEVHELAAVRNGWQATIVDRSLQPEPRHEAKQDLSRPAGTDRTQLMKVLEQALDAASAPQAQRVAARVELNRQLDQMDKAGKTVRVPVYDATAPEAGRRTGAGRSRQPARAQTGRAGQQRPDPDRSR